EFEDFSYREYLARRGIYSLLRRPWITLLARGRGNSLYDALFAFKRRAQVVIAHILPEPQAALLTGILLGVETGIPASLMDDFNATSTTHIIVISGFNIAIIAGLLAGLASRLLGRRRAVLPAMAGIALYTVLVGASAAVVRAAIMGSLYLLAVYYGRQGEALTSLVASAMLMTIINPLLLWDVGFQLSFAATMGLILYTPPLQGWFERRLGRLLSVESAKGAIRLLNDSLIVTVAAQITTLPIVVYHFRRLSLVTLFTNFLILPAQQGVMLWGGLATILGLIWVPLGRIAAWVAWLFLTYTIRIVELTASFPWASLDVGRFGPAYLGLYYGLLALGTFVSREEPSRLKALWRHLTEHLPTKAAIAGLVLVALLVWAAVASLPDGKLHVAFLNVGEAILIQTPKGSQILVDGGPDPTALAAALGRRLPFWDRTIELVVLTNPRESHLAGLIPVLERYRVVSFVEGKPPSNPISIYGRCLRLIEGKDIARQEVQRGMRIRLEDGLE
ncbi:MAG: ComEC/Rec2 family competence protein, partial [Chloroflexota bacterium]|nr:ComEC/Rec2 family competence protein [Chloroflexota bacterium]